MKDGRFDLPTMNPAPVEEMEEDKPPPTQEGEPPLPALVEEEEDAEITKTAGSQEVLGPTSAKMQGAGAHSGVLQTVRSGDNLGATQRT